MESKRFNHPFRRPLKVWLHWSNGIEEIQLPFKQWNLRDSITSLKSKRFNDGSWSALILLAAILMNPTLSSGSGLPSVWSKCVYKKSHMKYGEQLYYMQKSNSVSWAVEKVMEITMQVCWILKTESKYGKSRFLSINKRSLEPENSIKHDRKTQILGITPSSNHQIKV